MKNMGMECGEGEVRLQINYNIKSKKSKIYWLWEFWEM